MAATVVLLGSTFNTTSGTHTVVATPQSEDLIVIVTASSGNTATTAPSDNNSPGDNSYTLVTNALKNSSADQLCVFVRNNFAQYGNSTTFTHAPGTSTGGGLAVYAIRGVAIPGTAGIRQSAVQANIASGTPAPVFGAAALTGNAIISAVFNGTSPGGLTARSSPAYTRDVNSGYSTPTTGLTTMHINSGETGSTITWGSSSASAFSSIVIEIDTTITKLENHSDTFPGSSLDTTKWYDNGQSGATTSVSGNAVTITSPATTPGALGEVETKKKYTLVSSYAFTKAVVTQVASVNAEAALIVYLDENGNQLQITVTNGNLTADYFIGGAQTNIASISYNSTTMAWWRIRESSGTIYFDYRSDTGSWTNFATVATSTITWGVSLVRASVATYNGDSSATIERGVFSNFNVNQPPNTPTLTSPADAGTVITTTPELDFSDSDVDGDDLTYEVQIDTVNTFGTQTGYTTIGGSVGSAGTGSGTNNPAGLLVTFSSAGNVSKITAYVSMLVGAKSITCKLYTGSAGSRGSVVATSNSVSVTTTAGWVDFPFSSPPAVTATTYWLEFEGYGGDGPGTATAQINFDTGGASNTGYSVNDAGTPIYNTNKYSIYATIPPLLDKLSNTDTGFTDLTNGADTDPFASGDSLKFVVQAGDALTNSTTYYWRVRAKDPSGSNTYGSWSSTRSFTVSTGGGGGTPPPNWPIFDGNKFWGPRFS